MPAGDLERRPLHELQAYHDYTREHGLPFWRMEMQLAQIAMLLDAQRRPGQSLKLSDYIPQPVGARSSEVLTADEQGITPEQDEAIASAIGFRPRPKRRRPPDNETTE